MHYDLPDVIRVEADGPVRIVRLNRPEQLNAINDELHLGAHAPLPAAERRRRRARRRDHRRGTRLLGRRRLRPPRPHGERPRAAPRRDRGGTRARAQHAALPGARRRRGERAGGRARLQRDRALRRRVHGGVGLPLGPPRDRRARRRRRRPAHVAAAHEPAARQGVRVHRRPHHRDARRARSGSPTTCAPTTRCSPAALAAAHKIAALPRQAVEATKRVLNLHARAGGAGHDRLRDGRGDASRSTRPTSGQRRPLPRPRTEHATAAPSAPRDRGLLDRRSRRATVRQALPGLRAALAPLRHRCSTCGHRVLESAEVSGHATVIGFTVNLQQWLPDPTPPYVVAIVAARRRPAGPLITNVVDVDPDDVHVGLRVQVRFEQHEDVWLPVFAPVPRARGRAHVGRAAVARGRRAPDAHHREVQGPRRDTGIGMSRGRPAPDAPARRPHRRRLPGRRGGRRPRAADIDGLSTYPGAGRHGHSEGGVAAVEDALRIRPTWHNGGRRRRARRARSSPRCWPSPPGCAATCCASAPSGSRPTRAGAVAASSAPPSAGGSAATCSGGCPYGAVSAANWIGMQASQYFHRYGATARRSAGSR